MKQLQASQSMNVKKLVLMRVFKPSTMHLIGQIMKFLWLAVSQDTHVLSLATYIKYYSSTTGKEV